jgi:glycosyltransferase involved in cell wall biosynthesis
LSSSCNILYGCEKDFKVSVCMTTFNGGGYVKAQIESVLSQLKEHDELIICDDVSTDNTIDIIQSFSADSRIILKKNTKRIGVIRNFEQALKLTTGQYIFLCDQDDVWLEYKTERMIASLHDSILTVSDCKVVNEDLKDIQPSFFAIRGSGPGLIKNIHKNGFLGCCMAFRKELLPYILPIPESVPMHDMWIGLVAETIGKVSFIQEPLILYRRHDKNASPTAEKSGFSVYQQIKFRLTLSFLLIARYFRNIVQ